MDNHSGRVGDRVLIRDALHEDIPAICATMPEALGFLGGAPWQDPAYVAGGLKSCAANLSGKQKIKVVVDGETVVGCSYSGLALAQDGQTAHTEIGLMHAIAVRVSDRRRGAASVLHAACEEHLITEGARLMLAEVRPRAVPFFQACGYEVAAGPALAVPSAAGPYACFQTGLDTAMMWKNCSRDTVWAKAAEHGTDLVGVGGREL